MNFKQESVILVEIVILVQKQSLSRLFSMIFWDWLKSMHKNIKEFRWLYQKSFEDEEKKLCYVWRQKPWILFLCNDICIILQSKYPAWYSFEIFSVKEKNLEIELEKEGENTKLISWVSLSRRFFHDLFYSTLSNHNVWKQERILLYMQSN